MSIHTPEFAYEADPVNVRRFVAENDIRYPVALDPDSITWRVRQPMSSPRAFVAT